jgi:hypothetical protein
VQKPQILHAHTDSRTVFSYNIISGDVVLKVKIWREETYYMTLGFEMVN